MNTVARFPYLVSDQQGVMPVIPVLPETTESTPLQSAALLDTGASINVLPHFMGLQLGLNWDQQSQYPVWFGGAFGQRTARYVKTTIRVGELPAQQIVFGWMESDDVPLILGNANFFQVFDVCFSRSSNEISVRLSRDAA